MTYRCQKKSVVGPPPERDSIYLPLTYDADDGANVMDESLSPRVKRKYIDPWDLENYAYIHRNLGSSPEPSGTTPSPAGEPISSTFYYVAGGGARDDDGGGRTDLYDCTTGCYAGLDEELFYNAKYESIQDDSAYSIYYTDIESSSTEQTGSDSSCGSSTVSTLQLHTPGFGVRASGRRSIVLPKPIPHIEFPPAPPTHELYHNHQVPPMPHSMSPQPHISDGYDRQQYIHQPIYDTSYGRSSDCYECLYDQMPVYATNSATTMIRHGGAPERRYPPNNFGLSKRGLLQIDYSFNWNNLYRFMTK